MLFEGAQLVGESKRTYLVVSPLGQSNVWIAAETGSSRVVVIKEPAADDTAAGFPDFQREMVMHEMFKDSPAIRKQYDRIPPTKQGDPPMLVLEISQTTLWGARSKKPMSLAESKSLAKDVLIGLHDVHAKGLVYADLKPENIMVDGFNTHGESDPSKLSATLGDLGEVMEPSKGKVQPISFRAPEVYFKGDITSNIDVWGWGLIYCHLLEARTRFAETGLYDMHSEGKTMAQRENAVRDALSNDYKLQNEATYSGTPLPRNDPSKHKGEQWEYLRQRGLEDGEVDFLRWVLRADPHERPTVDQILESGWLDKTEAEVAAGFTPPHNQSLEYDPQRATPIEVQAQDQLEARTEALYAQAENDMYFSRQPGQGQGQAVPTTHSQGQTMPTTQHQPQTLPTTGSQGQGKTSSSTHDQPEMLPLWQGETPATKYSQGGTFSTAAGQRETLPASHTQGEVLPSTLSRWQGDAPVTTFSHGVTPPIDDRPTKRPTLSTKNTGTYLSYR